MSAESDEDINQDDVVEERLVGEDAAKVDESHEEADKGKGVDEDQGEGTKEGGGNGEVEKTYQKEIPDGEENYGEWNAWSSCNNQIYKFRWNKQLTQITSIFKFMMR